MSFTELFSRLVQETAGTQPFWKQSFHGSSLMMFLPELVLSATIVCLLLVRLFSADRFLPGNSVALFGTVLSLAAAVRQFVEFRGTETVEATDFFTGMLVYDPFTVYMRVFLLLFLLLMVYLTRMCGIPDREDAPDFYSLLLGSTIGMMLMASSNNMLMMFLGVEMTSVPSYVMVGFLKGRKLSSEAALKYVVYGAGAAGVMLYGISLLCGLLGTANLPEMADSLNRLAAGNATLSNPAIRGLLLALLMILVGVAFKLSIFPFHFWCPDAFEGASAEVAGFLSVASKGAALALLIRFSLAIIGVQSMQISQLSGLLTYVGVGIGAVAAVSATYGNLAAYGQTNMKRMLAYSTIAHAGYMLMGISAMIVILTGHTTPQRADWGVRAAEAIRGIEGILYYLWVYMFMNLGAFAIVALIRNEIFSEQISDYSGLAKQAPVLSVAMAVCLFSLVGIPPFGGFWGKFSIFCAVFQATNYHWFMWVVLLLGGINTVFSLFYYIRVIRYMYIADPISEGRGIRIKWNSTPGIFVTAIALMVLMTGIIVNPISQTVRNVATILFP